MSNPNKRSVIVIGDPRAKASQAQPLLSEYFGLDLLIPEWQSGQRIPPFNTLVMTTDVRVRAYGERAGCNVLTFEQATQIAGCA